MGRLINVDDVIELLVNHHFDKDKGNFDLLIHNLCKEVRNIPTAYDVDAVVKQLQQQAEQYHGRAKKYAVTGATYDVEHMDGKTASYEHSIEIVKGGGIDAISSVGN